MAVTVVSPGLKSTLVDLGSQWVLLLFYPKVDSPDVVSPELKSIRPMTFNTQPHGEHTYQRCYFSQAWISWLWVVKKPSDQNDISNLDNYIWGRRYKGIPQRSQWSWRRSLRYFVMLALGKAVDPHSDPHLQWLSFHAYSLFSFFFWLKER